MANYIATQYATAATLEVAVEAIATTVTIQVIAFHERGKQKFMLIQSA
jgi:serine/threonine protein kinase HipA of HipAB toxin-antitoxin module